MQLGTLGAGVGEKPSPLSLACREGRGRNLSCPPKPRGARDCEEGDPCGEGPAHSPDSTAPSPAHLLAGEACGVPVPPGEAAALQRGLLPGSLLAVPPSLRGVPGADPSHHRAGGIAVRGGWAAPCAPPPQPPSPILALLLLLAFAQSRGPWTLPQGGRLAVGGGDLRLGCLGKSACFSGL